MAPSISDKECHCFLEEGKRLCKKQKNLSAAIAFAIFFTLALFALCLATIALIKSCKLEDEVKTLRALTFKLKTVVDEDLYTDLSKFENEDTYSDEAENGGDEEATEDGGDGDDAAGNDVFDSDYDVNYYEEGDAAGIPDEMVVYGDERNDLSVDQEDLTELLKGGQFTKEGRETKRLRRDAPRPRLESENARNRRHSGKLIPAGGDGVHSAVPQFLQGYASPAWSSQHRLVSKGLKHYEELGARTTNAPPTVVVRNSRVLQYEEKTKANRKPIRKAFLKNGDHEDEDQSKHVVIPDMIVTPRGRRGRHRRIHHGQTLLPAIQFSGDTSRYVLGRHANFKGDGHLRHPNRTYVDWKENAWVEDLAMNQHFIMENGLLTIKEPGLYFTYAQIFYSDRHDINGFVVYKNQQTPLLQCTTTTHSLDDVTKSNTCYTAGVEYLSKGDQISLRDISFDRYSIFEPGKSFFGVVKLGNGKI